ncbi:8766_t:CDS:2, partial [Gigaspora margarita]
DISIVHAEEIRIYISRPTSYIILVCKEVHSYPPPLPQEVPLEILNKLKTLIESYFFF